MVKPIRAYFTDPANRPAIEALANDCRKLYEELAPTTAEQAAAPPPLTRKFAQQDPCLGKALYDALQEHCECCPDLHSSKSIGSRWHPARLCLEGGTGESFIDIMVSSMDMSTWQEFRLGMSASDVDGQATSVQLAQGRFCSLLEEQIFARIAFLFKPNVGLCQLPEPQEQDLFPAAGRGESLASILRNYQLTPRDKIVLAYAIARAYWQFYDSDLMRARWSSSTIYFMPALNDAGGRLPLRAFVSFPFGMPGEPLEDTIPDISIPLNHRCPRIFALGVLLLEIGLAVPFPTRTFRNQVSRVNFDHKTAKNQLKALRAAKWPGFSHAKYFGVEARRRNLFNHVVRPLAWLAETGFHKSSAGTSYIRKVVAQPLPPFPIQASPAGPTRQDEETAFHSGPSHRPGRWLDQLKAISAQVDDRRRRHAITKPVKVAILDTGLSSSIEYFQDEDDGPRRLNQVVGWQDFVNPSNDSTMVDDFGHGTLMARLVAEAAPFSELLIARVARNTKELPRCKDNIAKAILWAGEQGADVISMSFGFPREHVGISAAIQGLEALNGGVVLFASAGNSSHEDECFPASHSGVISRI
ncbi:hypothetical protein F5X68DRAFT_240894 [Plectosphaerella plurivora]|uniref:Peptidase S8/S53 domain-containing protein n=1 Tax=Plectosphaerella plurivora TaxID=936078 RepID=A0A9P8V801_9PEZI|nr:hypothetical protein F5X68DRAFT_240894 [Plectosphaerella plurivora]